MLSRTAGLFGYAAAEKICVSVAVLGFFWGAFALVSAASRRAPWFLTLALGMFAYGWTFNMGFFNFYLSLGLAFFGLAIVWRGHRFDFLALFVLMPLMWLAHPLGAAWFSGVAVYIALARVLRPKQHILLLIAGIGMAAAISAYLRSHYEVHWSSGAFYRLNGFDQLAILSKSVYWLSALLAVAALTFFVIEAFSVRERSEFWKEAVLAVELYIVIWFSLLVIPNTISLPQYEAPIAFVTTRLSLALGVVACCALASMRPRLWHVATFAAVAAFFFLALFLDTGRMNEMEDQAEKLVSTLPEGQRVVNMGILLPGSGWPMWHIVDRSCIRRCFVYSNYEPASKQFRVRGEPGNGIVVTDSDTVRAMQFGEYVVGEQDLPLYGVTPCAGSGLKLCGRMLRADERNGIPAK